MSPRTLLAAAATASAPRTHFHWRAVVGAAAIFDTTAQINAEQACVVRDVCPVDETADDLKIRDISSQICEVCQGRNLHFIRFGRRVCHFLTRAPTRFLHCTLRYSFCHNALWREKSRTRAVCRPAELPGCLHTATPAVFSPRTVRDRRRYSGQTVRDNARAVHSAA
jgi:hypothetical protein